METKKQLLIYANNKKYRVIYKISSGINEDRVGSRVEYLNGFRHTIEIRNGQINSYVMFYVTIFSIEQIKCCNFFFLEGGCLIRSDTGGSVEVLG